jgi:hypothetical protein
LERGSALDVKSLFKSGCSIADRRSSPADNSRPGSRGRRTPHPGIRIADKEATGHVPSRFSHGILSPEGTRGAEADSTLGLRPLRPDGRQPASIRGRMNVVGNGGNALKGEETTMKIRTLVLLILGITASVSAQTTIVLSDVQQPHQIAVDGNDLYVFDEPDYSLHVYTLSPFALKSKFGQKGDGPQDFKYLPLVSIQPETLTCTDFTKIVWFSKKGEVLKTMEFSAIKDFDINSEMLLVPVKGNYLRITADHEKLKRRVYLLDSKFNTIKQLYEGPFIWMQGSATDVRTDTLSAQGLAFIADTDKFLITIFDDQGALVRTIEKSRDVEKVPDHALLHQYCVADGKIYATTYKKKDEKTEMLVLDLEGRILRRLHLPLTSIRPNRGVLRYDLFTVGQDKLYELVQNQATGKWELLTTDLKAAR